MKYNKLPEFISKTQSEIYVKNQITQQLKLTNKLFLEIYPGIRRDQILKVLQSEFTDYQIIELDTEFINRDVLGKMIAEIGDDRIFAKMQTKSIESFYDKSQLQVVEKRVDKLTKVILIGVGTTLVNHQTAVRVHLSLPRWDIQKNYRDGMANFMQQNNTAENTVKFKFGYFFEWRLADKIKVENIERFDYFIDCSNQNYTMISNEVYHQGLDEIVSSPFRLTPFFDPGVWGGQWMKERFELEQSQSNYAWSFDGVPEENSICYVINGYSFNYPGIDIVLLNGEKLLGSRVVAKYGHEFPIRFDMLDTIGGQNLSLQVHPTKEYIFEQFGLKYTQEESYYILDTAGRDAHVFIGLKSGISAEQFFQAIESAYTHNTSFDVENYVNKISCKKGDHFLIPSGTIHCSGQDVMVLEISQTPYIFTFKLWDWERLDLNGKPRPINLEHGKNVLNEKYDTEYVMQHLYNNFEQVAEDITKSGLHPTQDIECNVIETNKSHIFQQASQFHMLNLVEGTGIVITSPSGTFKDYRVNQYETVIIPANVCEYAIIPIESEEVKYVQVYNK